MPCLDTGVAPSPGAPADLRDAFMFDDQDPAEVLAVPLDGGAYRVMLSDELSSVRSEEILEALHARPSRQWPAAIAGR